MKTYIVQIGNSDNRLTQSRWSKYVDELKGVMSQQSAQIWFFGFSNSDDSWQNCACVFDSIADEAALRDALAELADEFLQGSIALTVGTTEMIAPL